MTCDGGLQSRLAFKATQAHVRQGNIRNSWGELVKVGELVIDDEKAIFYNYCRRFLLLDILNLIPYPQVGAPPPSRSAYPPVVLHACSTLQVCYSTDVVLPPVPAPRHPHLSSCT